MRQCPAHADSAPSLHVTVADDGRVLVHCFAGCTVEEVLAALHCSWKHLHDRPWLTPQIHHATWGRSAWPTFPALDARAGAHPAARGMRLVSVHRYGDGRWLLERWRSPGGAKDLRWTTRRGRTYLPGMFGVPTSALPLYREREVRMAVGAGEPVIVVESESSVDAICRAGTYATTWAGGAASPNLDRLVAVLRGADVVLVPDHDEPGLACARRVWAALRPVTRSLVGVTPEPGQDARDLLAARGVAGLLGGAR
ncbi:hypothetical protein [Quadrisphaera setariae]|uniref:Toprim domain-containing protein n=1 Tax=Quadrisphaera setariae TaxID=2593304 RepID=A0A5C8ZGX8_9ACTN|nr:hypothetical protein [Quadrisphaera setariae]TXR56469.1 hypothetical protein FMM08_10300 [Quadrisphaera setariae]